MKSTWTLNEKSTGKLIVEVEPKLWQEAQLKVTDKAIKNVEVEGFRKGHAPRKLALKQLNQQAILHDAINEVAQAAYVAGVEEHEIEPVASPMLDIQAMTEETLSLVFDVTVKPDVELGEYKGIEVERVEIEVTDEDVEVELKRLQEENAELVVVEDGVVEAGNTVIIDYEGFKDGVAFEGGKAENYSLEIGSNMFIPGFEDALIGTKVGETRDIELTFPEEYQSEELKGQDVVFTVTVHEIKVKEYPALDDDFVALLENDAITTLDELKASIRHDIEHEREHEEEHRVIEVLQDKIVENAKIEIPDAMIEEELDHMIHEFKERITQQGISFEMYTQFMQQTEESLRESMKDNADRRIRLRLVLEKIAAVEELKAEQEEIDEEYQALSERYGIELDQVKQIVAEKSVNSEIVLHKAMELVQSTRV